jgi:hypothetical protein
MGGPDEAVIVSWIDYLGFGRGNLANSGGGGLTAPLTTINGEITGATDGVNITFTLSTAPAAPGSMVVFVNGVYQVQGTDYIIFGTAIVFSVPPSLNAEIVAILSSNSGGGGITGGSFSQAFSNQSSVTILGATHQLGTANIVVAVYDNNVPANQIQANNISVNFTTYDVVVSFFTNQSGTVVLVG